MCELVAGATDAEARNWLSEYADDAEATNSMSLLGVAWTYNCSNGVVGALDEDYWRVQNGTQVCYHMCDYFSHSNQFLKKWLHNGLMVGSCACSG